jgi:XTP/dITP diphosphohydrolase
MKQEILLSTYNRNKLEEIRSVAKEFEIEILSIAEYQKKYNLPPFPVVVEDDTSYYENAHKKASAAAAWGGNGERDCVAIGDDSGLEIRALNGEPGIFSARFGGEGATDLDKINLILTDLENAEDRSAKFLCELALVSTLGRKYSSRAEVEGEILTELRGEGGFGYDPIFYFPLLEKTYAEFSEEELIKHGFRGIAVRKLFKRFCGVKKIGKSGMIPASIKI